MLKQPLSKEAVYTALRQVIDPELHIDIVSLGLVYEVQLITKQIPDGEVTHTHIIMTLTTPGCPLAHVFEGMVKDGLRVLDIADVERDVTVELTFDPPWLPDMMSDEAKAELGFD